MNGASGSAAHGELGHLGAGGGSGLAACERVAAHLGGLAERYVSLRAHTTFRVGGPANVLVRAQSVADLWAVRQALAGAGGSVEVLVVGQGSNLLIGDAGITGVVVVLGGDFESIEFSRPASGGQGFVTTGAAVKLPLLARRSGSAGFRGLEWMVGVPGSVGGAVRMNAGGHGADVAESIVSADVFSLAPSATGGAQTLTGEALGLSYRSSALGPPELVTAATFRLQDGDRNRSEREMTEIVRWRREHQPGGANCGSVFTNPAGDSAGRLIESAGCKGLRIGSAAVSEKHANFIQADPGASAADIWALINDVRRRVFDAFGIDLHPEVRTAGFRAVLADLSPVDLTPPANPRGAPS